MVSYLQLAIASTTALTAWECYLLYRQHRAHKRGTPKPKDVEDLSDETFEEIRQYTVDKVELSLFNHVKSLVEGVAVTLYAPQAYRATQSALLALNQSGLLKLIGASALEPYVAQYGGFVHGWAFCIAADILDTTLSLPISIYSTFWMEAKHGFNKTTKTEFVKDLIKSFILRVFLMHPLVCGLLHSAVTLFGEQFPLYLFGAASVLMLAMTYILPTFIQPLFNKFTILPKGTELEIEVRKLADKLQFPLTAMYVIDGSRRSGHSNAYFYGFWKNKRIVFYDTLLDQMSVAWNPDAKPATTEDEAKETEKKKAKKSNCGVRGALAVLCHEFGHWKMNHTTFLLGMSLAQLLAMCYGAKSFMFSEPVFRDFGFEARDVGNALIGFQLFTTVVLEPLMTFVMYGMSVVSRKFEFQADAFAVDQGYGVELQEALKLLQEENKGSVTPDWLFSMLHHTHPPMRQRLAAIRALVSQRHKKDQ